jgi:hypothetical protein
MILVIMYMMICMVGVSHEYELLLWMKGRVGRCGAWSQKKCIFVVETFPSLKMINDSLLLFISLK